MRNKSLCKFKNYTPSPQATAIIYWYNGGLSAIWRRGVRSQSSTGGFVGPLVDSIINDFDWTAQLNKINLHFTYFYYLYTSNKIENSQFYNSYNVDD